MFMSQTMPWIWITGVKWRIITFVKVITKLFHSNTKSTGTVHNSAKAGVTSVAMRIWIRIHIRIRDLDRCQNLISCSLAHCQHSLKLSSKSVRTFLHKVANRETDRQRRKHNILGGGKDVDLYFSVNFRTYYIYRPFEHFSGPGTSICRVCVCLCVTVKTITSELNELWPSYLPFGTPVQQVSPVDSVW